MVLVGEGEGKGDLVVGGWWPNWWVERSRKGGSGVVFVYLGYSTYLSFFDSRAELR